MNNLMPPTTTATELQRNFKSVIKQVKQAKGPVTVLSNNKPELILIDYALFSRLQKKHTGNAGLEKLFGSWTQQEAEAFNTSIDTLTETIDDELWPQQ